MSPATMQQTKVEAKTFPEIANGLDGMSKEQIEQHFKLYNGYVTNVNILIEKIGQFIDKGDFGPEYAELKRRMGFEIDGVILHELYFGNMKPGGSQINSGSALYKAIEASFGSYQNWETDFRKTGAMRGIGWAILYRCGTTGHLFNFWITDHENGHPAGFTPLLVMDVWEHAYCVDWKPTERPAYIDAFFKNINWEAAEKRYNS